MAEGQHRVVDFDQRYRLPEDTTSWKERVRQAARRRWQRLSCRSILESNFSVVQTLKGYSVLKDFPNDVISGVTVGIMQIPQGMAYAALATLPPICGLYSSLFGPIIYFFLGNSRYASMGTIAVVSLMIGSVLDASLGKMGLSDTNDLDLNSTLNGSMELNVTDLEPAGPVASMSLQDQKRIEVTMALTFVSGLVMMGLGKLGLGFVTSLMPDPLISGFTTGVAVHVLTSQMKNILDIKIPRHNGVFKIARTWVSLFTHITQINWATFITSVISMIIMYLVKICINQRFQKRLRIPIPIELLVIIVVTGIAYGAMFKANFGVSIVGTIPAGIPTPRMPDPSLVKDYIGDAVVIGVVAFAQSVSMAKTLALKHGQRVDSNQEMFAYGASSLANSFFSGYVPAFSLARSLVQEGAGGRTQVASLVMCVVVLVVVVAVGPLFYHLPKCILSAVILVNLRGMFRQVLQLPPLWRHAKYDLVIWVVTFLATVILDADLGLATGIGCSLLSLVIRTQRSLISNLGEVANTGVFRQHGNYKEVKSSDDVTVLDISSPIYFANTEIFREKIYKATNLDAAKAKKRTEHVEVKVTELKTNALDDTEESKEKEAEGGEAAVMLGEVETPRRVILNMAGVLFLDSMGVRTLKMVLTELQSNGVQVELVELKDSVVETLRAADFPADLMDKMYISLSCQSREGKEENGDARLDTSP